MEFVAVQTPWFFGYDIILELIFAVIVLILAAFALRFYKVTSERSTGLLGAGFLFIAVSYFFQSVLNFLMVSKLGAKPFLTLNEFSFALTLQAIGAYGQMLFMLVGLIILLYMTFEFSRKSLLAVMLLLAVVPVVLSPSPFFLFYFIATICFIFVAWHFVKNYLLKKKRLSLIIAVAFVFLAFGAIGFVLSVGEPSLYVLGHMLSLIAYVLMLVNFYMVLKK